MAEALEQTAVRKNGSKFSLTLDTMIPLSMLGMIVGGAVWATRLDARVANLERGMDKLLDGTVTQDELRSVLLELKVMNPTINVPDHP